MHTFIVNNLGNYPKIELMNLLKQISKSLLITSLLCFLTGFLQAQPTSCFDFNNLELGTKYGLDANHENGDTIRLIDSEVITTLQRYNYIDEIEPAFWNMEVVDWEWNDFKGENNYLFISNINLVFDFSHTPDVVSLVQFDFAEGGEINIGVNGHTAHIIQNFDEVPREIAPGVEFEVEFAPNTDGAVGTVFLHGSIHQLVIGGQEFAFDNFCYVINDVPPMCIDNIIAIPQACTPNNIFYTEIKFDAYNPPSDSFYIRGNGQNYGKFAYGQSSYKVGPIDANPDLDLEFVIIDALDPNCTNYTEIGPVFCNEVCRIYDLETSVSDCQADGRVDLKVNFAHESLNGDKFTLWLNGKKYESYKLADLPVILEDISLPTGNNVVGVCAYQSTTIFTDDNFECCVKIEFDAPDCGVNTDCKIYDLEGETSECFEDGTFALGFNFQHQNANTAGFDAFIDGKFYEFLPYSAGEGFRFSELKISPGEHKLTICGNDNPNCCESLVFKAPECKTSCKIYDLGAEAYPCNDQGTYLVDVFFKVENPASDSFTIESNDGSLGTFAYGQNFYTVGPLKGNGLTAYYFAVVDQKDGACGEKIRLDPVSCNNTNCTIRDLVAEVTECRFDGSVDLVLNFEAIAISATSTYSVYIGDRLVGSFPINQNPLTISGLQLDEGEYKVSVCLDSGFVCCQSVGIYVPECQGDCRVSNLETWVSDCQTDGTYNVKLDFDYNTLTGDVFEVIIGGEKYDTFKLSQLPLEIKGVKLAPGSDWLGVCVFQSTTPATADVFRCCIRTMIEVPNCEKDCKITDLVAETSECFDNGFFALEFKFDHSNFYENKFKVIIDGDKYDFLPVSNNGDYRLELKLSAGEHVLTICGAEQEDCCARVVFQAPDCGNGEVCNIRDMVVKVGECLTNGAFNMNLNFNHNLPEDGEIKVLIDGEIYEYFPVLPEYFLQNLKLPKGTHKLTVCHADDLNCCESIEFEAPGCEPEDDCKIYEVFAEAHPCDDDGKFLVDIEFKVKNPNAARFQILGNGTDYGTFEYGKQFYTIGPIKGDGVTEYEFIIKDLENPTCKAFTTLDPIKCSTETDCDLNGLRSEVSECFSDGTVNIKASFKFEKESENGFNVFIDEDYVETYSFQQIPFSLSKINLPAGEHKLSICRNDEANCCISTTIYIPECGNCLINNVTAVAKDCENEDFFFVELKFDVDHPSSDRFRVIGNSNLYGVFEYGQDAYRLGPLDGDGSTMYEFIVQDLHNETCASFAELEKTINCEQGFVWPGDANFDNVTNNLDLLNVGLAFGERGPARPNTDITSATAWEGQTAEDWELQFTNGLNIKHADCNGDGLVDEADIRAIQENYLFTHGPTNEPAYSTGSQNDPALFVDFPALSDIELDKETKVPIIFGDANIPAEAYGLAFTLKFDSKLIKDAKVELTDSWMGKVSQDLLSINKNFSSDGLIEVALTRTDGVNPFGAGSIGQFIIIIDNIEGYTGEGSIEIQKVQAVDQDGNLLKIHTPKTQLAALTDTDEEGEDIDINIFPNPTSDYISIQHKLEKAIEGVTIRSVSGKLINTFQPNQIGNIDVSDFTNGVYIIEIKTNKKTIYQKLVKQ